MYAFPVKVVGGNPRRAKEEGREAVGHNAVDLLGHGAVVRAQARFAAAPHAALGNETEVDTQRLNTAIRILQSEFDLAGVPLVLTRHADLLANLYGALGPGGTQLDTGAMLSFNQRLAERLQRERQPV